MSTNSRAQDFWIEVDRSWITPPTSRPGDTPAIDRARCMASLPHASHDGCPHDVYRAAGRPVPDPVPLAPMEWSNPDEADPTAGVPAESEFEKISSVYIRPALPVLPQ